MKTHLLNYLLEASICLTVFYTFYYILLRKERFFASNRAFLLLALLLSLLIPAMEIPLSRQAIYLSQQPSIDKYFAYIPLQENTPAPVATAGLSEANTKNALNIWDLIFYGYVGIAFLLLGRLLLQVMYLYKMARHKGSKQEGYTLVQTAGKLPTFSFFHFLFWNNSQALTATEKDLILQHELVHIRQKHSLDSLLIELVKVVFWFHPVVYLFQKALQEVHEYLADQAVVEKNDSRTYTRLLASQQLHRLSITLTHSFNQSQLYKRIAMIQSVQTSAKPALWKMAFALPVLAILLFTYSCKTSEISEPRPEALAKGTDIFRLKEIVIVGYVKSGSEVREIQLSETITGYGKSEKKAAVSVYDRATVMPQPINGMISFQQYLQKNIQLQAKSKQAGKVWVQFIVDTDGSLQDIKIRKGLGNPYDEEAIRLIKNGPSWNAGRENGEPVAVRQVVPVSFGGQTGESLFSQIALISEQANSSQPAPVEGMEAFYKKVGKTIRYPAAARQDLAEGQVWVEFTVNTDGSLSGIEIKEKLHPELDQEVLRVVAEAGLAWKPAIVNGKAQATRLLLPLSFKLG